MIFAKLNDRIQIYYNWQQLVYLKHLKMFHRVNNLTRCQKKKTQEDFEQFAIKNPMPEQYRAKKKNLEKNQRIISIEIIKFSIIYSAFI